MANEVSVKLEECHQRPEGMSWHVLGPFGVLWYCAGDDLSIALGRARGVLKTLRSWGLEAEFSLETAPMIEGYEDATDSDDFEGAVRAVFEEQLQVLLKKHHDYGPLNIARAPGGPLNGLRVRMYDKLARINNLVDAGVEPENESLVDSFADLANYGIIGVLVLRGQWPEVEKGE